MDTRGGGGGEHRGSGNYFQRASFYLLLNRNIAGSVAKKLLHSTQCLKKALQRCGNCCEK